MTQPHILPSESSTAYSLSVQLCTFTISIQMHNKNHLSVSAKFQPQLPWHPAGPLSTLELKIRLCLVSKFSSFPWSKQSRSLTSKINFFAFFLERFVSSCKATRSKFSVASLSSIFDCSYISFRSRDKRGHAESICRNHMLHLKQSLSASFKHTHSHYKRVSQPLQKSFTANFCGSALTF